MTTLIVDASHFMHRCVRAAEATRSADGHVLDFKADVAGDRAAFLDRAVDSICAEWKRGYGMFDRVVYCMDSYSWRKDAYPDYKSGRKRDDAIDWKVLQGVHDEFASALEKAGCVVSRQRGAEGDDLAYAWSMQLNGWGSRDCVILSGDGDLSQLVGRDRSSGRWTVQVDRNKKTAFVFPGFAKWSVEEEAGGIDIFDLPSRPEGRSAIVDYIRGLDPVEVDPMRYIFCKILTGDPGDTVPSVHSVTKQTKVGDRVYGFTLAMAHRVLDRVETAQMMVHQWDFFSDDFIAKVCALVLAEAEEKLGPVDLAGIVERWKRNRDLVFLHKNCMPPALYESMETQCSLPTSPVHELSQAALFDSLGMNVAPPSSKDLPSGAFDPNWKNLLG